MSETDSDAPEATESKGRLVVRMLAPVIGALVRRFGVSDEDVQALFVAGADRMVDAEVLVQGGTLVSGQEVRGVLATQEQLGRVEAKLDTILEMAKEVRA